MSEFNRPVLLRRGRTWPTAMGAQYPQPPVTPRACVFVLRHHEVSSDKRGTQTQGIIPFLVIKVAHVHYLNV